MKYFVVLALATAGLAAPIAKPVFSGSKSRSMSKSDEETLSNVKYPTADGG